jgi:hypothetical protein
LLSSLVPTDFSKEAREFFRQWQAADDATDNAAIAVGARRGSAWHEELGS